MCMCTRCTHIGIFVILHTWHTSLTHTDASAPRPIISFASRVRFVSREATIACKHHRKLNMVDVEILQMYYLHKTMEKFNTDYA